MLNRVVKIHYLLTEYDPFRLRIPSDQLNHIPVLSRLEGERWFRVPVYQDMLNESVGHPFKVKGPEELDAIVVLMVGNLENRFDYDQLHHFVELLAHKHKLPVPTFIDMTTNHHWGILVYHNLPRKRMSEIEHAKSTMHLLPFNPPITLASEYCWYPSTSLLGLVNPYMDWGDSSQEETSDSDGYHVSSQEGPSTRESSVQEESSNFEFSEDDEGWA
ncbi:hypothetical protein DFH28DRAFT_1136445 [Melampsora americana]|nr:hypothetical protein DFH28DRAFT_1136445 [Melampsora americana]